ncbi:MAG TPA: hypothetical protein PKO09_08895 [Anaerolineae bacterium]|nr:hypothetical protein [Anaerolineae bacterium]
MRNSAVALVLVSAALVLLAGSAAAQQPGYNILIVDDDWDYQFTHPGSLGGLPYYTSALDALGLTYEVWDTQTQGQPAGATLQDRDAVLWFTGYAYEAFESDPGVFTVQNELRVGTYLDNGGRFLLSSQEYYFYADAITPFMSDYLGVLQISDVWVYTTVAGVPGNPIGDGVEPLALARPDDYGDYWPPPPFEGPWDDEVYARPEAGAPFLYDKVPFPTSSTNFEAGAFKTVFLGWPFEWIDTVNQRAQVMGSILCWMGLTWPTPEAPLLSPIENADGNGWYTVDWSDSVGTITYTLEEDEDPNFSSPTVRYHGPDSEHHVTSQPLGTWYYRAKAAGPEGDSGWSNVEPVTVTLLPPPAPALHPIENGDLDGDFWVLWDEVPDATVYVLEEDDSDSFGSPDVRYQGPNTQAHIEDQSAGIWFYRVRATAPGGESPWSNVESTGVVPEAPQLAPIANPDGDGTYQVDWSDVVGATSYTLQEDDNPGFNSPATRYIGPSSLYPIRNQPAGSWYYRVRASNAVGTGPWSNTEVAHVVPAAPVLLPIANDDGDGEYVVEWKGVAGALTYSLEEDTDPAFGSPVVRYAGPETAFAVAGQRGGTWYYRVRGSNAGGAGPWSGTEWVKVRENIFLPLVTHN